MSWLDDVQCVHFAWVIDGERHPPGSRYSVHVPKPIASPHGCASLPLLAVSSTVSLIRRSKSAIIDGVMFLIKTKKYMETRSDPTMIAIACHTFLESSFELLLMHFPGSFFKSKNFDFFRLNPFPFNWIDASRQLLCIALANFNALVRLVSE